MISTTSPTGCCRQLAGYRRACFLRIAFPTDAIVIARAMGAAELLDYPRANLRGLVLEEGAVTSHVVIVARAMGIPVVGNAEGVAALTEKGDADHHRWRGCARCICRPAAGSCSRAYEEKVAVPRAPPGTVPRAAFAVEPVTRDGRAHQPAT